MPGADATPAKPGNRHWSEMVPARDGVRLATNVHLPDGAGPFPVILERTPYGRDQISRSEVTVANPVPITRTELAVYFTAHGYAVVFQDNRGRHGSEGVFVKYLSDGDDGYDCCAWIVAQDWCDGRICTMGLSYAAHTQAALGCLDAPGVVAQVLDSGGFADAWRGGIRQWGAFELKQATWAHKQAILSPEAEADPVMKAALEAEDIRDWFTRMPWQQGHSPLRHHPAYEAYLFDQWRHGAFDAYWQQVGIWAEGFHARYSMADCVHMSSWYDAYPLTATANYLGLRKAERGPQRLILGPWTHGDRSRTVFGDVDFGSDAAIDAWAGDWRQYRLRHFDSVIKGLPNPEPAVRLFMMGGGSGRKTAAGHLAHGGHWLRFADWPPPDSVATAYHLQPAGLLDPAPPARTRSRYPSTSTLLTPCQPSAAPSPAWNPWPPAAPGTRSNPPNSSAAPPPTFHSPPGPTCWCSKPRPSPRPPASSAPSPPPCSSPPTAPTPISPPN